MGDMSFFEAWFRERGVIAAKLFETGSCGEDKMIKVDLANLSADELQKMLSEQCSLYGVVERISVIRNGMQYAIASISMRNPTESQAVKQVFGDLLVDNTVLVRLEQQ